jgi:hypothetical protein
MLMIQVLDIRRYTLYDFEYDRGRLLTNMSCWVWWGKNAPSSLAEMIEYGKTNTISSRPKLDLCPPGRHPVRHRRHGVELNIVDAGGILPTRDHSPHGRPAGRHVQPASA